MRIFFFLVVYKCLRTLSFFHFYNALPNRIFFYASFLSLIDFTPINSLSCQAVVCLGFLGPTFDKDDKAFRFADTRLLASLLFRRTTFRFRLHAALIKLNIILHALHALRRQKQELLLLASFGYNFYRLQARFTLCSFFRHRNSSAADRYSSTT